MLAVLQCPGFVLQGTNSLPQCCWSQGLLFDSKSLILGPALSTTLTLQVRFWPWILSSSSCNIFFNVEKGVYVQNSTLSILGGVFDCWPFGDLDVDFCCPTFWPSVLFWNQVVEPVSFAALLLIWVCKTAQFQFWELLWTADLLVT